MEITHQQVHQQSLAKQEGNKMHKISEETRGSPEPVLQYRLFEM